MTIKEMQQNGWAIIESYQWLFGLRIVTLKRDEEVIRVKVNYGIVIE